jgi:hypothetical protein
VHDPLAVRTRKRKGSAELPRNVEEYGNGGGGGGRGGGGGGGRYDGTPTREEVADLRKTVRRDLQRETVARLAEGQPYQQTLYTVAKNIETGSRGGASYIGRNNKRIWLKKDQRRKCRNGTLNGAGDTCPRQIKEYKRRGQEVSQGDDDRAWWWWE